MSAVQAPRILRDDAELSRAMGRTAATCVITDDEGQDLLLVQIPAYGTDQRSGTFLIDTEDRARLIDALTGHADPDRLPSYITEVLSLAVDR